MHVRVLPSGLTILHTRAFSTANFTARVLDFLLLRQGLAASLDGRISARSIENAGATSLEIARLESEPIALGLVDQLLDEVEHLGGVVRDEQTIDGLRWYSNQITALATIE